MTMPIKISNGLKAKLPEPVRATIEDLLWDKSGGFCFLCEEPLNRAAEDIEADHDLAEAEGGPTNVENLNLAHVSCNRAKRNARTIPIKPYLKLLAYAKKVGGRPKYDGFLSHFGIEPKKVVVTREDGHVRLELPDGTITDVAVISESNAAGAFDYVFLPLPREAIFNDEACQPRPLRTEHAWSIYSDIQTNVLHEPPSCRLEHTEEGKPVRLLMFDGQHKTVANWMMGREEVTAKVYLNLSLPDANRLVNSIQAKIKKLPLSPFELAGKMSDEWENKFSEYEDSAGSNAVSEKGFIDWLPQTDRNRGKQALQSALVQNVLTNPDLRLVAHVVQTGAKAKAQVSITEQALKGKVLEKLLTMTPLDETGDEAQAIRDREAANVVVCLNLLTDEAFEPTEDATALTVQEAERARRMTYQASLAQIATMIRQLWARVAMKPDLRLPMADELSEAQWTELRTSIKRLVAHPAWTADFGRDPKMTKLKTALEKNQEVPKALESVGLDLAYLILGDDATTYKNHWLDAPAS